MGALFSSETQVHIPQYQFAEDKNCLRSNQNYQRTSTQTGYYHQSTASSNISRRNVNSNYAYSPSLSSTSNVYNDYTAPPVSRSTRSTIQSIRVSSKTIISNSDYKRFQQILCSTIIRQSKILNGNILTSNKNYKLIPLESRTVEFDQILKKFMKGVLDDIHLIKVERIENPYLLSQYLIKKLEYENKQLPVKERILFHGTKRENIDNICSDNFDWRRHGQTKGNIFGKGVSFTPKSTYANHYCGRKNKVMIVVNVLVANTCAGNKDMIVPDYYNRFNLLRYDTSIKEPKKDVLVKYSDDEFYPAYLIHYRGTMFYPNKGFAR